MPRETESDSFEAERQNLIAEAIAETHDEIFRAAFDKEPEDGDGDTSLEELEEVPTDVIENGDEEEDEDEGEDEGEDEQESDEEGAETRRGRGRPNSEQADPRGERDRGRRDRRVAESERDAARAELDALRAEIAAMRAQQQPRPGGEQPQPPPPPDLFSDPEGRLAFERQQWAGEVNRIISEFNNKRINSSFDDAREDVGDERFGDAFQALYDTGDRGLINEVVSSNNPGRALMRWHERQSLMSEMGSDPEAYIERRIQERLNDPQYRQQYIGGMRDEAQRSGNSAYDLPPSLNSASGGMSHRTSSANGRRGARGGVSDKDIFLSAWDE